MRSILQEAYKKTWIVKELAQHKKDAAALATNQSLAKWSLLWGKFILIELRIIIN